MAIWMRLQGKGGKETEAIGTKMSKEGGAEFERKRETEARNDGLPIFGRIGDGTRVKKIQAAGGS